GKKGAFTFQMPHEIAIEVPRRLLSTYKEMVFRAPYLEGMPSRFLQTANPVVLDIGANAGYFSFFVLSKFPKAQIHAFEPFPPNFKLLESYQKAHSQFGLHLHPVAVAGQPGQLTFNFNPDDDFSTSASLQANGESATMEVQAITLPDFVAKHGISQIDWLKVDCEGAEYDIFRHLNADFLANVRAITVETHDSPNPGEDKASLNQFLQSQGFNTHTNAVAPLIWAWK
ncbi:MAG: FkbM family methyltransferase, partial [Bacteroidota bacterium]